MKKLLKAVALGGLCLALPTALLAGSAGKEMCEDLKGGTPGLFGLCMAYWNNPCEPDFTLDDPYEGCKPASRSILENYQGLMEPGDPYMPGVAPPPACPCWTDEELSALPYPSIGSPGEACINIVEIDDPRHGTTIYQGWSVGPADGCYWKGVFVLYQEALGQYTCEFEHRKCAPDDSTTKIDLEITPEEFAVCRAQVIQSGRDRNLCFLD